MSSSVKKSVHFAPTAKAMLIPHVDELCEDEINAVWYSRKEYKNFKKDCQRTASLAKQATLVGSETIRSSICDRGLECMVNRERSNLRSNRRNYIWDAILDEQFQQQKDGTHNPQALADLYRTVSAQAQCDAHQVGLGDQQTVLAENQEGCTSIALTNKQPSSGSRWTASPSATSLTNMMLAQRRASYLHNIPQFAIGLSRTP